MCNVDREQLRRVQPPSSADAAAAFVNDLNSRILEVRDIVERSWRDKLAHAVDPPRVAFVLGWTRVQGTRLEHDAEVAHTEAPLPDAAARTASCEQSLCAANASTRCRCLAPQPPPTAEAAQPGQLGAAPGVEAYTEVPVQTQAARASCAEAENEEIAASAPAAPTDHRRQGLVALAAATAVSTLVEAIVTLVAPLPPPSSSPVSPNVGHRSAAAACPNSTSAFTTAQAVARALPNAASSPQCTGAAVSAATAACPAACCALPAPETPPVSRLATAAAPAAQRAALPSAAGAAPADPVERTRAPRVESSPPPRPPAPATEEALISAPTRTGDAPATLPTPVAGPVTAAGQPAFTTSRVLRVPAQGASGNTRPAATRDPPRALLTSHPDPAVQSFYAPAPVVSVAAAGLTGSRSSMHAWPASSADQRGKACTWPCTWPWLPSAVRAGLAQAEVRPSGLAWIRQSSDSSGAARGKYTHMPDACEADVAQVAKAVPPYVVERSNVRTRRPAQEGDAAGRGQPHDVAGSAVEPIAKAAGDARTSGWCAARMASTNLCAQPRTDGLPDAGVHVLGGLHIRGDRDVIPDDGRVAPPHTPPQPAMGQPPLDPTTESCQAFAAPSSPHRSECRDSQLATAGQLTGLPLMHAVASQPHADILQRSCPAAAPPGMLPAALEVPVTASQTATQPLPLPTPRPPLRLSAARRQCVPHIVPAGTMSHTMAQKHKSLVKALLPSCEAPCTDTASPDTDAMANAIVPIKRAWYMPPHKKWPADVHNDAKHIQLKFRQGIDDLFAGRVRCCPATVLLPGALHACGCTYIHARFALAVRCHCSMRRASRSATSHMVSLTESILAASMDCATVCLPSFPHTDIVTGRCTSANTCQLLTACRIRCLPAHMHMSLSRVEPVLNSPSNERGVCTGAL